MAREVVVTLEEDEDSWKVRCLAKLYSARRLSLLLEGRSLPLHHHSLCIFLRNYAKDRGENISTERVIGT